MANPSFEPCKLPQSPLDFLLEQFSAAAGFVLMPVSLVSGTRHKDAVRFPGPFTAS